MTLEQIDAVLRECYRTEKYPLNAAIARVDRGYGWLATRANKLGLQRKRKARRVVAPVAVVPLEKHPVGYVRPILCPHCLGIVVIPADPMAR